MNCALLYTSSVHTAKTSSKIFTFYTRLNYYKKLVEQIQNTKKGDRIAIATMAFEPSEAHIELVMDELCKAAKRGVTVRCTVDSMAFMLHKSRIPGPLLYSKKLEAFSFNIFSSKRELLNKLAVCGGEYAITNRPKRTFINPFSGRSHIKFAIINDQVYIGGCNLKEADRSDLMVHWTDNKIADWLFDFADKVRAKSQVSELLNKTDVVLPVDSRTSLLIDAGVRNQSLIFENAIRLIDEAKDFIFMTCQYFPNDITIKHLSGAVARGVNVQLIYNHPSKHSFPMSILHTIVKNVEKKRNPAILFKYELSRNKDFLHAKLLATEKACIVGSHNYVWAGVQFGTAEIALLSTSPSFAKVAINTIKEQLQ